MKTRNPPRMPRTKPKGGRPRKIGSAVPPTSTPATTFGVDPALIDPRRILAGIAADTAAPAAARVAACKALLRADPAPSAPNPTDTPQDALTQRTLALMKRGRPN